jgi:hypothetical protein
MDSKPQGTGSDSPGPKILRPIPRRPFDLKLSSPTPPEEEEEDHASPRPQISASDLRFLAPHQNHTNSHSQNDSSTPLSHTTSYLNLTAPTLYGIYSPSITSPLSRDEDDADQYFAGRGDPLLSSPDTPLEGPAPRPGLDEETYQLMCQRASSGSASSSSQPRRRNSLAAPPTASSSSPRRRAAAALQLLLRAGLLFVLGVGYGVLVTRLPQQHGRRLAAYESPYEWRYLAFWGAAGVALGSLLPWFDRFWEESTASRQRGGGAPATRKDVAVPGPRAGLIEGVEAPVTEKPSAAAAPRADWALVVRGVGAFVGIVFAIRKLPWASTMQVSLTLALANPFLWYLIDRSKPGFLLSAAVGLAGSVVLMGLNPDVMPAPTANAHPTAAASSSSLGATAANDTASGDSGGAAWGGGNGNAAAAAATSLWGLASQETIETGIWMLSVLFCSCVCFGNIGRRLALNSSAAGRGRWGGVR